jgi:hypothetical protein
MQHFLTAIAFLLAANLPIKDASAAEPYEGLWAEKLEWCKNTNHDTDEAPITITRRSIETFASSCRVITIQGKAPLWRIRTSCRGEGESEKEKRTPMTFSLRVDGNKLAMREGSGLQSYLRCPR